MPCQWNGMRVGFLRAVVAGKVGRCQHRSVPVASLITQHGLNAGVVAFTVLGTVGCRSNDMHGPPQSGDGAVLY